MPRLFPVDVFSPSGEHLFSGTIDRRQWLLGRGDLVYGFEENEGAGGVVVESAYGYSHAVQIGDDIKVSGAVSMDDEGNPTAVGDLEEHMKNVYSDLEKVLHRYGCTFDDVVVENVFTTDMAGFLEVAGYRSSIYTKQFPTGTWLDVKGLALPEFMIEIALEAHRSG